MQFQELYNYCSFCGSELKWEDSHFTCTGCEKRFYLNPKPTAAALLSHNEEFLFVTRAHEPAKGKWDIPGGFLEAGETFEAACRREIKEELGIEAGELNYFASYSDSYLFQEVTYPVVAACFVGVLGSRDQIAPADDVASVAFFRRADIPMENHAFPSMQQFLEDYLEIK